MDPRLDEARRRSVELSNKLVAYLQLVVPALRRLVWLLRFWSVVGIGAVVILVASAVKSAWPLSGLEVVLVLVITALAGWAPVVMLLYASAVDRVAGLPEWIRSSPDVMRERSGALAKVYLDTAGQWGEGSRFSLVGRGLWRSGRLAVSVAKEVPEFAAAGSVVNPFLLASTAISTFWVGFLVVLTPVAFFVLLFVG